MAGVMDPVNRLFNHDRVRRVLVKLRLPLAIVLLGLLLTQLRQEYFWWGLGVSFVGALLQWWCFSCIHTSKELAVNGPYMFVRNPMYLSRFFWILGGFVMTGNLWLIALYCLAYWFYMANRVKREERKLKPIFGEPYEAWCRAVPRFLPKLTPYRGAGGRILYGNVTFFRRNHGFVSMLTTALIYLFVYVMTFKVLPRW